MQQIPSLVVIAEVVIVIITLINCSHCSPVARNKRSVRSDVRVRVRRSFPCYINCLSKKDQHPMIRPFVPRLRDIEEMEKENGNFEDYLTLQKRDSGTRSNNDKVYPRNKNLHPPKPYYHRFANNNKRVDKVYSHILRELNSNDIGEPENYKYSLRP